MNKTQPSFSILLLSFIALMLWGCSSAPAESHPLENTLWQAERVTLSDGTGILFDPMRTTTVYFQNGQAAGRTACNFYTATYTADDKTIALSEDSITQADCLNEALSVQERVFIDKLFASEVFVITNDELTLIYPGGSLILRSQPDTKGDEIAVYASVLREWQGENLKFLIVNDTAFNAPGVSLDATLNAVQDQIKGQSQSTGFELGPATLEDFRTKNSESHPLEGIFPSDYPIEFVTQEYLDGLFAGGTGWETFYAQYPDATTIFTLSAIGFNPAGDQALVHIGRMSETDSGDFYHLLTHNNGIWVSNLAFRLENP